MSTTAVTTCSLCPGRAPADGTLVDVCGDTRDICADCLLLVWNRDWAGFEQKVVAYQSSEWTQFERLRLTVRARRVARNWTRWVRILTVGRTARESARRARRERIRNAVHELTGVPTQRPGEHRFDYQAEPWMTWIARVATRGK